MHYVGVCDEVFVRPFRVAEPSFWTPPVFELLLRLAWHFPVDLLTQLDHLSSSWSSFDHCWACKRRIWLCTTSATKRRVEQLTIGSVMFISIHSTRIDRCIVLIRPSTKRLATSIAPLQADEHCHELSRIVSSALDWHTAVLNDELSCSLSVLSATLFLPQNSNPWQMTLTGKLAGPLSKAQAHEDPDSQSKKLSTIISSLSVLQFTKKLSVCVSGTSPSELRRVCGKSGIFPVTELSHQLRNGRCVASDVFSGSDRILRGCPLVAWNLNSPLGQVSLLDPPVLASGHHAWRTATWRLL